MSNFGYSTLQVIPSLKGAEGAISGDLAGVFDKIGGKSGSEMGDSVTKELGSSGFLDKVGGAAKVMGGVLVAGVGAAVGTGAALFGLGEMFDNASDQIRIKTGKTGADLASLKGSFDTVFQAVPTDAKGASDAVAGLNQHLGISGDRLNWLATQELELSRLTGTDLNANIDASAALFGNWNVEADKQAGTLDKVFRASQATGIGVTDLMTGVTGSGAQLREMGFGLDDSLALLGKLKKEGIDSGQVLGGLTLGLRNMAKAGEEPAVTLKRAITQIKLAGTESKANEIALKLFGRSGIQMAAAIRAGTFDLADMSKTIATGTDTVAAASADTQDLGEKWTKFKNRVFVGLEPLANKVFDAVGSGADRLMQAFSTGGLGGVFNELGTMWGEAWPGIQSAVGKIWTGITTWFSDNKDAMLHTAGDWISAAWNGITSWIGENGPGIASAGLSFLGTLWTNAVTGLGMLFDQLGIWLPQLGDWFINVAVPYVESHWGEWWDAFTGWVADTWNMLQPKLADFLGKIGSWVWNVFIPWITQKGQEWGQAFFNWLVTEAIPWAVDHFVELLRAIGQWLEDTAIPWLLMKGGELKDAFLNWLSELPGNIKTAAGSAFNGLVEAAKTAFIMILTKWNELSLEFDVPDWIPVIGGKHYDILPDVPIPKLHSGGVFTPPSGNEGLALLLKGETVRTTDQEAALQRRAGPSITQNIYSMGSPHEVAALSERKLMRSLTRA